MTLNAVTNISLRRVEVESVNPQQSQSDSQCAVYFVLEELPENLKSVRIEVDMKCNGFKGENDKKMPLSRQWLKPQILSNGNRICGFKCFHHQKLEEDMSLEWTFAVKAFKMEQGKDPMMDYEFVRKMFDREIGMECRREKMLRLRLLF